MRVDPGGYCPAMARLLSGRFGRVVELGPALRVDAVNEQVRVEAGLGEEGEHAAGGGFDRHQRAATVAEYRLGDFLQLDVERQREVVAGLRRRPRERADAAPGRIDLDLFHAGGAVQFLLVARFQPCFADEVGASVVRPDLEIGQPLLVLGVDAADVADHMRSKIAVRILAEQARLDLHAREAVAVGGEARHFLVGQARADRQALGVARFGIQLAEPAAVLGLHVHHLAQLLDGALEILYLGREDFQRVSRVVARQHHAIAVEDEAAVGRDRHDRDAVVLGFRGIGVVLHDLQLEETREQQRESHQHRDAGHADAQPEHVDLTFVVPEFREAHRSRLISRGFRRSRRAAAAASAAAW